jgi:RecA-family ATPase
MVNHPGNGFDAEFATPAEWARLYRSHDIQIVPAFMPGEPARGGSWKRPLLKQWTQYQDVLVSDAEFDPWYGPTGQYRQRPNMGVITGRASSNLFVVDLDTHTKPAAANWWCDLMELENNGLELETVEQRTGGGGLQKLFRAPAGWTPPTCKTDLGVDIRGQGGFAMLCPSLHESGRAYEWLEGCSPDEIDIAMAPGWLLAAVEELVVAHGGSGPAPGGAHQRGANGPQEAFDGFGHQTDGREEYMRDLIWAAVIDWYRECPIPPGPAEQLAKEGQKYLLYEEEVSPRLRDPLLTKTQLLDREDRGPAAFHVKWQQAMKHWDGKVAEEARKPGNSGKFRADWFNDVTEEYAKTQQDRIDPATGGTVAIDWLDMSNWDNVPVPTRKWAIRDRVPLNQVGLFSGEGGSGKSIIELMKDVAHVTGKEWLGSMPEQGGAFYLGAEDEADEIHIRLAAIAAHYGTTFKALVAGGLRVLPLLGKDSMLCVQMGRGNHVEVTPLYRQLLEAAGDLKPKNISIDTLSRAFGGDEINRVQVYAFAMHMQALAKAANGSVTILSHPSLSGLASGSGISGSTAWHGAFRFRQYLKGIKDDEEADPSDQDLRELEFKKNQYGPKGRPIVLRYKDGLFLPVNGATDPERLAREARADGCFVNLLRRINARGDIASHIKKSIYFAPSVMVDEPEPRQLGFRKNDLEDAMRRLMASGRVITETYGKVSRPQRRLILSPGT